MTSSLAGAPPVEEKEKNDLAGRFGACGGGVCGLTLAAAGGSSVSCLLLLLSVCTTFWDSVTFDFAQVNQTLNAASPSVWQRPSPLYSNSGQLAGLVLLPVANDTSATNSTNSTTVNGYCLLNVYSSLWNLCDTVNSASSVNADYSTYCSSYSTMIKNKTCFNYIADYNGIRDQLDKKENSPESQIMKMQNNAMACCIVVLLCVAASIVTGAIGLLARVVPSIMITSVLHLTAGVFIIFSSSIQHEKVSRMMRKPQIDNCLQCVCYSLIKTPEQLCNSAHRSVSLGWSVAVLWLAAASYLITATCWLALTRRTGIEKAKTMV